MTQKMTWEEMKRAFPDEWLLITDFKLDKYGGVEIGRVERHSPKMNDFLTFPPLTQKDTAFVYTGESTFAGLRSHATHDHSL